LHFIRLSTCIMSFFIKKYLGQPYLFSGARAQALQEKIPVLKWCNNVLNAAPAFKWGLSIVPLYGVFVGSPKVENIDLKQSVALATTGGVWTYYATLVKPRANILLVCSAALLGVHGFNISRRLSYEREQKAK